MTEEEKARGKLKADARRRLLEDDDADDVERESDATTYALGRYQVRRLRPWMREVEAEDREKPEERLH